MTQTQVGYINAQAAREQAKASRTQAAAAHLNAASNYYNASVNNVNQAKAALLNAETNRKAQSMSFWSSLGEGLAETGLLAVKLFGGF